MITRLSSFATMILILFILAACNFQVVDTRPPADATATAQARTEEAAELEAIEEEEAPQLAYDIKGNINSAGEKIYHMPGGQYYDRVKVDLSRGEQYFATEEEALDAGYRKASR